MKHDIQSISNFYHMPLPHLLYRAHGVHAENFDPLEVQQSTLLSIKTGRCPENCSYCPQSAHYKTEIEIHSLLDVNEVVEKAKAAKANGATRFCMGAAWREVKEGPEFDKVLQMVEAVNAEGLQTCCTLGMLTENQAVKLKDAGLYAYNHNIDTSREYYEKIITTRKFDDRLQTIANVRAAGITVCTGGILGMGESESDRISFLHELSSMNPQPESVTINALVPVEGTPLEKQKIISVIEVARVIACARILMPRSMIRLSAGRMHMTDEGQFLCFFAGANSVFLGDRLLTSPNPSAVEDHSLLKKLDLVPMQAEMH